MSSHNESPLNKGSGLPVDLHDGKLTRTLLSSRPPVGFWQYALIIWAALGPGVLAIIGDNDAGGDIAYAVTGVRFGISGFIPLILCLGIVTYTVQEMSMRLSAASATGFAQLIFSHWGRWWGYYHIVTLFLENLVTLLTEFIGMTAGLMMTGLSLPASDAIALGLVLALLLVSGYKTKERLVLILGFINFVFLGIAYVTHPDLGAIARVLATWRMPPMTPLAVIAWYVIAAVGNSLAPWMVFFQGDATLDKGVTPGEIRMGRVDTAVGTVTQIIVAAAIIVIGASLYGHMSHIESAGPTQLIAAIARRFGLWPAYLFGFGLFDAGLLAAITISLSSSWTIAGALKWNHSLNAPFFRAPKFYSIYIGSLMVAAGLLLVPRLPLDFLSVLAQVVGGVLMAPVLIFLVILTSDAGLMGPHRNGKWARRWSWVIVSLLIAMALLTLWNVLI